MKGEVKASITIQNESINLVTRQIFAVASGGHF